VEAGRCDDGLRLVTNPAFVSTDLRAKGCREGRLIAEVTAFFADRSERIRPERTSRRGRSIRCGERRARWKTGGTIARATIYALNRTNRKQRERTMACRESSITAACYLCNTRPKTAELASS